MGIDELLLDLGLTGDAADATAEPGRPTTSAVARCTPATHSRLLGTVERDVARLLLDGPARSADSIVMATRHSAAVVAGALTLLQLRGWVLPMGPLQVAAGPLLLPAPRAERYPP